MCQFDVHEEVNLYQVLASGIDHCGNSLKLSVEFFHIFHGIIQLIIFTHGSTLSHILWFPPWKKARIQNKLAAHKFWWLNMGKREKKKKSGIELGFGFLENNMTRF